MNEPISPEQVALRDEMYKNLFSLVEMRPQTGMKSCNINAQNLSHGITFLPDAPCDIVMVSTDVYGMDSVTYCKPEQFKNIKVLAFAAISTPDPESRLGISERFREWLKTLPVEHIAFNRGGFSPIALKILIKDPELNGKILINDDLKNTEIGKPTFDTPHSRN